jgi:N-acetylglucosamine kinase-like BadF-type ATPase
VGVRDAVNAIGLAAERAVAGLTASELPALALIAMAGEKTHAFKEQVTGRLAVMGVSQIVLDHDLLGIFHSGTAALDGYALIAGTGTVAARIRGVGWVGSWAERVGFSVTPGAASGSDMPWPRPWSRRSTGKHKTLP